MLSNFTGYLTNSTTNVRPDEEEELGARHTLPDVAIQYTDQPNEAIQSNTQPERVNHTAHTREYTSVERERTGTQPDKPTCTYSDVHDLTGYSASTLQHVLSSQTFDDIMQKFQQKYQYVNGANTTKPIRGTKNAKKESKVIDLRALLSTKKIVDKTGNYTHDICKSEVLKIIADALEKDKIALNQVYKKSHYLQLQEELRKQDQDDLELSSDSDDDEAAEEEQYTTGIEIAAQSASSISTLVNSVVPATPNDTQIVDIDTTQTVSSLTQPVTNTQQQPAQANSSTAIQRTETTPPTTPSDLGVMAVLDKISKQQDKMQEKIDSLTVTENKVKKLEETVDMLPQTYEKKKNTNELRIDMLLMKRQYMKRRQDCLNRGTIKIALPEDSPLTYADSTNHSIIHPDTQRILRTLDIKHEPSIISLIKPGRKASENRHKIQPFIICDANTGFTGNRRIVDNHPDHATRIIFNRRNYDGMYINRCLHDDEHLAQIVFTEWKAASVIKKCIVSSRAHYMIYFHDESFIRARIPLNLIKLTNPTPQSIKDACEPDAFVYNGEVIRIPDTRNSAQDTQQPPIVRNDNRPNSPMPQPHQGMSQFMGHTSSTHPLSQNTGHTPYTTRTTARTHRGHQGEPPRGPPQRSSSSYNNRYEQRYANPWANRSRSESRAEYEYQY